MKTKSFIISLAVMAAMPVASLAQDSLTPSLSADLVSEYIWRGQNLGGASFQPGFGIAYKGISLSAWGSVGFDKEDTREVDLTLGYSVGKFSVSVTDYWFSGGPGYFKYGAHDTSHVFEAQLGYDFGPVAINWYTNFAGNAGVCPGGSRAYSSYVEVSAPFTSGPIDWNVEVGASPYATSFYNCNGFAVTNVGIGASHQFPIAKDFGLTVFGKGVWNPCDSQAYAVLGVSFATL